MEHRFAFLDGERSWCIVILLLFDENHSRFFCKLCVFFFSHKQGMGNQTDGRKSSILKHNKKKGTNYSYFWCFFLHDNKGWEARMTRSHDLNMRRKQVRCFIYGERIERLDATTKKIEHADGELSLLVYTVIIFDNGGFVRRGETQVNDKTMMKWMETARFDEKKVDSLWNFVGKEAIRSWKRMCLHLSEKNDVAHLRGCSCEKNVKDRTQRTETKRDILISKAPWRMYFLFRRGVPRKDKKLKRNWKRMDATILLLFCFCWGRKWEYKCSFSRRIDCWTFGVRAHSCVDVFFFNSFWKN